MKKLYSILAAFFITTSINSQCPTFSISAPNGTTVGCIPNTIPLNAVNTSTLSSVTYTWTSLITGTNIGSTINASSPSGTNIITVTASAPSSTCISTQTIAIIDNAIPPSIIALAPVQKLCGQFVTGITAGTATTSTSYSYTWSGPLGTIMSCPGGMSCSTNSVSLTGTYTVNIKDISNGCSVNNTISVLQASIMPSFTANPNTGCYPLSISFLNNTPLTGASSGTVSTTWDYGNSSSITYTGTSTSYSASGYPNGSTTYTSAGTYSVILTMSVTAGSSVLCSGIYSDVIVVSCVGVEELSYNNYPSTIYPNPATNILNIEKTSNIKIDAIVILDITGRKVLEQKENTSQINIEALEQGIYQLQITSEGKNYSSKFIKE